MYLFYKFINMSTKCFIPWMLFWMPRHPVFTVFYFRWLYMNLPTHRQTPTHIHVLIIYLTLWSGSVKKIWAEKFQWNKLTAIGTRKREWNEKEDAAFHRIKTPLEMDRYRSILNLTQHLHCNTDRHTQR